jgi:signal transduction histidine kinase
VLLLLATLAAAQAVNAVVVLSSPPPEAARAAQAEEVAEALAGRAAEGGEARFAVTVGERPPYDNHEDPGEREFREALARRLGAAPADVRVVMRAGPPGGGPPGGSGPPPGGPGTPSLLARIGAPGPHRPVEAFSAAVRQPDGLWRVAAERHGLLDPWQRRALLWLLGSVLLAAPLGYLFARRLTAPIRAFAEAAERLGRDPRAPALAAEGPAEIGAAARAFNEMQERLRRYVEDRTAMVGAIAHDLRTPLTRLAFRLEAAPEELRAKAAADIAEMEAMIAAALAFVRDATRPAARERLELGSLVESVVADMAETGSDAAFVGGGPLVVEADPLGLRRAIANLVVNACRYGARARARVRREGRRAVVEVDDDGPGLPEGELERVFEPFHRADRSRGRGTGGVGLGLAVVRAVVLAHGGEVVLENRREGGLRARVTLPL